MLWLIIVERGLAKEQETDSNLSLPKFASVSKFFHFPRILCSHLINESWVDCPLTFFSMLP